MEISEYVVLAKHEFERQDQPLLKALMDFLQKRNSYAKNKINTFYIDFPCTSFRFLIETMMAELKVGF